MSNFSFDFFAMSETGSLETRVDTMTSFMKQYGILESFDCKEAVLANYIGNVFTNYYNNPYHNSVHAMDVANSVNYMLKCGVLQTWDFPQFEINSLLMAAFTHDLGHPGVNNMFLQEMKSGESIIYNDQSILENLHSALSFKLLAKPNSNYVENISREDYKKFRKFVINLIIGTDLSQHIALFSKFKNTVEAEEFSFDHEDNRLLFCSILIKASDIGHGAKVLNIHKRFSRMIIEEFYAQVTFFIIKKGIT